MATPVGRKLTDVIKPGLRVFISAGASGIGRAIADMLILHGAKVHICDVSQDFLNDFKQQHPQHGATLADVSKEADVARLFKEIAASLGGLDALINNAGIAGPTRRSTRSRPQTGGAASTSASPASSCAPAAPCRCSSRRAAARSSTCPRPPAGTATRSARPIPPRSSASSASPRASPRSSGRTTSG